MLVNELQINFGRRLGVHPVVVDEDLVLEAPTWFLRFEKFAGISRSFRVSEKFSEDFPGGL